MFFNILAALAILPAVLGRPATASTDASQFKPQEMSRAYFVNCYTSPTDGTRSEVDFFRKAPLTRFGHATPQINTIVSDGINEVWENNGGQTSATVEGGATFVWTIKYTSDSVQKVVPGYEVGNATLSTGQKFALFKGDLEQLYSFGTDPTFGCVVVYTAVQTNRL